MRRAERAVGAQHLGAVILQLLEPGLQPLGHRLVGRLAPEQVDTCVDVGGLVERVEPRLDRQLHRVHAYPALTRRGRVEERRLQAACRGGEDVLLVRDLDSEDLILVDVWEREQVRAADEEVAVECRDAEPFRDAHAHDRLPPLLARQAVLELA